MKNLNNYPTLEKVNKNINGELTYSLYLSGIAYESWFDANGNPITPLPLDGMTYNFSTSLAEDFGTDENSSRQIILKWDDKKTLFYKGIMIVEDEVMYVDTTIMKSKPYSQYGKIAIPVIDIDGNKVIQRGINGTKATPHLAERYCRSAINFTNSTLDISYNDNAELSESKPFSPVVSSGTVGINISAIEWGNKEISGEKNIYKVYEINNRLPVYCFVGTRNEKVCEFVAFISSFNIMPTKEKIEIRVSDKTSLYWNEEINKSYQFNNANIKDVISVVFDYDKSMIKYPNSHYVDEHFMKVSNLNTNLYKTYRDIMQELSKEMLFRMSFNSSEEIIIQSEVVLTNNTKNPNLMEDILKDDSTFFSLTDTDNIFSIERATSSGILYNKIDNEFKEYKAFFDGSFFELSYDSAEAIYPVSGMMNIRALSEYLINNNETHRRYIYDTDNSKLYMACYEYLDSSTQIPGIKQILVNNKETCTIEEARAFRTPIKYKYSKQVENLRILDRTIDNQELMFNTVVIKLPKEQSEMLDPYGRENGEYVVLFDGVNDFHGRVVDISVVDKDYYDVTISFGYDKDYDYNFKGKTEFLSKFRHDNFIISYENDHKFVMYLVRKELPYVWEYKRGESVSNVKVPIFGNDTFEVWANFGGIDTDDGKFAKMVDGIEYLYDNIYKSSAGNEYSQFSPVYMRSMMVGEFVSEKDGINSMYITDFSNDNLIMQILRSKPTEDLPKNTLVTGMANKNNNSSDMYIRITTNLYGSTIKLNMPITIGEYSFKAGTKFVTVDHKSSEAISEGITEKDLFDFYIVKPYDKVIKIPKDYAETVASSDKSNNEVLNTFGKVVLVSSETYEKTNSGDIIIISEPTEDELKDPAIKMIYQKYKDARWMITSKSSDNDEYALYLDYQFPDKMRFDIISGYIYGNSRLSGYCMLQQLSIKGNPILEYSQRYYYENVESVSKYGDKTYSGLTGKFMSSIDDVNSSVSYIVNGFAGLTDKNQKMIIPISTSHIVGMEMLDTVRVLDRVYGTYDKVGVLVGKDFSVSSSGIKYNLKVFTMDSFEDDAHGAIGSISEYKPIEFPTFGYKDGDGGWESSGKSITKNDDRVGEIKFKKIDQSLFTLSVNKNFFEGKQMELNLSSPSQDEMSDKDFSEIFKAGSDLIIEDDGVKHLITIVSINRETGLVVSEIKLKNLFEKDIDLEVTLSKGTMLNMYQTITVMDEMSSIIDRVEIVEKENDENFGNDGVLGDSKPQKPLNFRLEPAVNGFLVKLNHPDSKNIKGYNIYYRMIGKIVENESGDQVVVEPEDNIEREMFTSATLTFVSAVGKRKYEVYLRSLSHKGQLSEPTLILSVDTKVLGFDDIYYPPGQSPDELDEASKDLANSLANHVDILQKADEYLRGQYGSITEDLEKNYYTKVDTDEQFSIGFGKVQESVLEQSKTYTDTQFGVVDGKINASVEKLEEKYTILGGEIDWAKSQINMTEEKIDMFVKETNIKIDDANKQITDNYSEFIQTSKQITTAVGEIETRITDAEITIEKEVTEINQRADGIELIAQRTEAKVDKQSLIGSNYLYNSGNFSTGKTITKELENGETIEEVVKDDSNPLYWQNINVDTQYPCSVTELTDGTKVIRVPHTEGIKHQGIYVPGGNTYYCSATVKIDGTMQSNAFEPINLWISSVLDPSVEGIYGLDYELDVLGTHIEKQPDPENPDVEIDVVVPDEFPIVNSNQWSVVKIKVIIKGSDANKVRIIPKIKTNTPEARTITVKDIQFRMGEEYKTWEPSIDQSLNPTNLVSLINITPDEIKLDSKLIKIGGGIVVEGENVAVNNLSAKRLQLGDSFYYTEGDKDDDGNLIPDTERLIITKLNLGQIEALNPSLPSESFTIEEYIKSLDDKAKEELRGDISDAKNILSAEIEAVNKKAEDSIDSLKGMAIDNVITGQEKSNIQTEYKNLYNRIRNMEENIRQRTLNEPLFGEIDLSKLSEVIYDDTKESSLISYLTNIVKLYEVYIDESDEYKLGMLTTTEIDPQEFNEKWKGAYDEEQSVLNRISDILNALSARAEKEADTAKKNAERAQRDADFAQKSAEKANIKAQQSMQNIGKATDDSFLSSAEKQQMETDWIELRDSSNSIKTQIENSGYKDKITTIGLIQEKITGVGNDSLFSYLSSNETKFFNIGAFEEEEVDVEVSDGLGGTIIKKEIVRVYGTRLMDIGNETGGDKFTRKWQEAFDARQKVLNEITKVSDERLIEAQNQAILSMYGQYDPFFRQYENHSDNYATLPVYTLKADGDGKNSTSIIREEGFYIVNSGEYSNNPVLRVEGVKSAYWKNTVKISDGIHYKLQSRIKAGNVFLKTVIGVVCLDGNFNQIARMSLPEYLTTNSWSTTKAYISKESTQYSDYVFPTGTVYVRPYLSVTNGVRGNYTLFQSLEFEDAQDEINKQNIEDIFDDGKITADEKKELSRTFEEIKVEKAKIDRVAELPTFKGRLDTEIPDRPEESRALTKYYSAYNNIVKMFNGILDKSLPDVIDFGEESRKQLNTITAEYYSSKDALQARMAVVAREVATEDSTDYSDLKDQEAADLIRKGYVVLSSHTAVLGSFVVKSTASTTTGVVDYTPGSDYTEIAGGLIRYIRGVPGKENVMTTIGPHVFGELHMEPHDDNRFYPDRDPDNGSIKYYALKEFPAFRDDVEILPAISSFDLTQNIRSVSVGYKKVPTLENRNLYKIWLDAAEEEYKEVVDSFSGRGYQTNKDAYGIDVRRSTIQYSDGSVVPPYYNTDEFWKWLDTSIPSKYPGDMRPIKRYGGNQNINSGYFDCERTKGGAAAYNKPAIVDFKITITATREGTVITKTQVTENVPIWGKGDYLSGKNQHSPPGVLQGLTFYLDTYKSSLETNHMDDIKRIDISFEIKDPILGFMNLWVGDDGKERHNFKYAYLTSEAVISLIKFNTSVVLKQSRVENSIAGGSVFYLAQEPIKNANNFVPQVANYVAKVHPDAGYDNDENDNYVPK